MSVVSSQNIQLVSTPQYLSSNQSSSATDFSSVLADASSTQNIQTTAETSSFSDLLDMSVKNPFYRPEKPSVKEFMDASGASFEDAVDVIYGVIGSNADYRDWTKIMASQDPMSEARRATGQNYTSGISVKSQTADSGKLDKEDSKVGDNLYKNINGDYAITASDGTLLSVISSYASAEGVIKDAARFGIDVSGAFADNASNSDAVKSSTSASLIANTQQYTTTVSEATNSSTKDSAGEQATSMLGGYATQQHVKTINDALSAFSALQKLLQKV